ncbi:hypothetical protein K437DRAFT_237308 [Tilletiaria anomala UBC 951]|uniref:Ribonuclease H n=1 Tax=Tilletiaria anomala (strain ATCC 24038 / CBS 436.72 / UBC 951) TaxID=1037660 RepID=A0A066VWK1_TILAU|nr:uncharacterized protein K437DRAFT_237308 [Tilletiaria anomala UBC 951]KDN43194.1 hypothetical protein K437DRAFT_237308 [Tilletiaria anomala UBC 951]
MGKKSKGGFYAVRQGRNVGIFTTWDECRASVDGFSQAQFKRFDTRHQAEAFIGSIPVSNSDQCDAAPVASTSYGSVFPPRSTTDGSGVPPPEAAGCNRDWYMREVAPDPERAANGPARAYQIVALPSSKAPKIPLRDDEGRRHHASSTFAPPKAPTVPSRTAPSHSALGKRPEPSSETFEPPASKREHRASHGPRRSLDVWCDGSSLGNGKVGSRAGWGVYFGPPGTEYSDLNESCRLPGKVQTNNRAELMAIIRACELCQDTSINLQIHTDSQYSMKAINVWQQKWREKGWKLASGGNVQNRDLIERIEELFRQRDTRPKLIYVPGHSGDPGNEAADKLAKAGALRTQVKVEQK